MSLRRLMPRLRPSQTLKTNRPTHMNMTITSSPKLASMPKSQPRQAAIIGVEKPRLVAAPPIIAIMNRKSIVRAITP